MKIIATNDINSDAATIRECIDNLDYSINEIVNYIEWIPNIWAGDNCNAFIKKYEEVLKNLREYKKNFDDYYTYLTKVYSIFETLDENYNKAISLE